MALEGTACLVPARDPQRPFRDNALLQEIDRRKGILQRRQLKQKSNQLNTVTFNLMTSGSKHSRN